MRASIFALLLVSMIAATDAQEISEWRKQLGGE
jgi:hypothetical protein